MIFNVTGFHFTLSVRLVNNRQSVSALADGNMLKQRQWWFDYFHSKKIAFLSPSETNISK